MQLAWLILGSTQAALAAEPVNAGAEISTTARLGLDSCVSAPSDCSWINFRDTAVVSPWVKASPSSSVRAKAALDVRLHGPGEGYGLESNAEQQAWSLRIHDIWVATKSTHVELKVGSYRTAWGVANGVSVVDTINPYDLENPTQFDRRLSVPTASLTAFSETFSVTGSFIPFFVPASLPNVPADLMSGPADLIDPSILGNSGTTIGALESRPTNPDDSLGNLTTGIQLRWTPQLGDFALSWHHGRDSLPQVSGDLLLVGYQTNNDKVDVGIPLIYPKQDVFGLTARAPLGGDITGWTETAVILPEPTSASPSAAQLDGLVKLGTIESMPNPIPEMVTQDGNPIVKWIVGIERPFGPVRLTGQWMHGFFTERAQELVEDYALLGIQWNASEVVRVDANGASNFTGHLVDLSLLYLFDDVVEMQVGATHIDGNSGTAFGGLSAASNLYTRVSMKF